MRYKLLLVFVVAMLICSASVFACSCGGDSNNQPSYEQGQGPKDDSGGSEAEKPKEMYKWIMLGTTSCPWCEKMKKVLGEAKTLYKDSVTFEILDYYQHSDIAEKYGMSGGVPMNIFVDSQGKKVFTFTGYKPLDEVKKMLEQKGIKPNK